MIATALTDEQQGALLHLLFTSSLHYNDSESQRHSRICGAQILQRILNSVNLPRYLALLSKYAAAVTGGSGSALSSKANLCEWLDITLPILLGLGEKMNFASPNWRKSEAVNGKGKMRKSEEANGEAGAQTHQPEKAEPLPEKRLAQVKETLLLLAKALDAIMAHEKAKPTIKRGALVVTRRSMRIVSTHLESVSKLELDIDLDLPFQCNAHIPFLLDTLLASPASSALTSLPLIGLLIDVSLRLRVGSEPSKGLEKGVGHGIVRSYKDKLLAFYITHAVSSKTAVPTYQAEALHDFFEAVVLPSELDALRATLDKMLLRSPEISTPVAKAVFEAVRVREETDRTAFGKHLLGMQAALSSALRSTNAQTREKTIELLRVLLSKADAASNADFAKELVSALKSGKVASSDARAAAFDVLAALPPSSDAAVVLEGIFAALEKEQQDVACQKGLSAAFKHIASSLNADEISRVEKFVTPIAKLASHAKVPVRHAAFGAIGSFILTSAPVASDGVISAWKTFGGKLLPIFEAGLKNAGLGGKAPAGPLEGYVSSALLKGKMRAWDAPAVSAAIEKNEVLQHLMDPPASGKPSFLLNDKVVRKVASEGEHRWLLLALQSIVESDLQKVKDSEDVQAAIAFALSHCAESKVSNVRRLTTEWVRTISRTSPSLSAALVRAAAVATLRTESTAQRAAPSSADVDADQSDASPRSLAARFQPLIRATCTLDNPESISEEEREEALLKLFVPAHHSQLGGPREAKALSSALALDLQSFVERRFPRLLLECRAAMQDKLLADPAYAAITTLASAAPEVAVAEIVTEVERQLNLDLFKAVTPEDVQIWRTPEGELCVDVLAQQKNKQADKNSGKDAKIDKWEAELRESIEKKRAAAGTKKYTKEEQSLINKQLAVESETRKRVEALARTLHRNARIVQSLVAGRSDETESYVFGLVKQALSLAELPQVRQLAPSVPFEMLSCLATLTSERVGPSKHVLAAALLRTLDESLVPESFQIEELGEAVLRILYRLRFLSEQSPLDLASVSIIAPLIARVVRQGGIGVSEDDADGTMEQIRLALDFITFHCGACEDPRYPRADFMDVLLHIVAKHTQLAKDAVSALRSLGEGMKDSALSFEIEKLLSYCIADEVYVRSGSLQALQSCDLTQIDCPYQLWLACHDVDEENARLASKAWEQNDLEVPAEYGNSLIAFLEHPNAFPRQVAPKAIASAAESYPTSVSSALQKLIDLYRERNKLLLPEYDKFGMIVEGTENRKDPWEIRSAIASTFSELAEYLSSDDIAPFFTFLIKEEALGDRNESVRIKILDAASAVIDVHGEGHLDLLIDMMEDFFKQGAHTSDGVTEAVVILLGRLARHLKPKDPRLAVAVKRLLEALHTPSELVQSAVSDCLPPLIRATPEDTPALVNRLMDDLIAGAKYAHRRGAAYGLAGVIKGRGISSIAEFKIMERLEDAAHDKDKMTARQGAMFAYECLTASLRVLFEPYILGILPHLLACFGDPKEDVREATQDAARVIMQSISGHCVKLILPTLLAGLEDKQWRSKKGAIELLGAMAYCAPRQLSVSLPKVIPPLSEVLSDSHTQVKSAANKSLKQFGEVINNPEIKKLTNKLLQALINPNDNIGKALTALLNTSFVHYIDSASLALVVPIVERGLKERGASLQRDAARIVGNLAGLTDSKDFVPYLRGVVPLVRVVLVSPVPEARSVAAKALGTLVERLGEVHFVDLVPSLLQVLRSDATGVDRQGSAQGLAEILAGLGAERMEALLPEIINNASNARAYVRAGYISLLIYLPATFGHRFAPHLGRIIPPILGGIADPTESVREASMRAGRMIIANYSSKAVDLLLPELERGMFDEEWRIRMSSIQLVADLLFRLSGISGKNEMGEEGEDEEDGAANEAVAGGTSSVQRALAEVLGEERRDRVLSALYIVRQDPNIPVRQAAIHTWKALVLNTPRTAREILPTMLDILIRILAAPGAEQREIAGRTLAELVRKLGERILRDTIPILRNRGVTGEDPQTRAGVCFAVTEVLQGATKSEFS